MVQAERYKKGDVNCMSEKIKFHFVVTFWSLIGIFLLFVFVPIIGISGPSLFRKFGFEIDDYIRWPQTLSSVYEFALKNPLFFFLCMLIYGGIVFVIVRFSFRFAEKKIERSLLVSEFIFFCLLLGCVCLNFLVNQESDRIIFFDMSYFTFVLFPTSLGAFIYGSINFIVRIIIRAVKKAHGSQPEQ